MPSQTVSPHWLTARLQTLFHHFYQPGTDAEIIAAAVVDWFQVLSAFPQHAVEAAFNEWLRVGTRRPAPSDIRSLVVGFLDREARLGRPLLPPPPAPPEPDRVRVTPEAAARILAEAGLTPARLSAIAQGRRMPPPSQPGHVEPEPLPVRTAEEAASRPYTPAELARMAALRPRSASGAPEGEEARA